MCLMCLKVALACDIRTSKAPAMCLKGRASEGSPDDDTVTMAHCSGVAADKSMAWQLTMLTPRVSAQGKPKTNSLAAEVWGGSYVQSQI